MSKDIAVNDQIVFNFLEMIDYIIKCLFSLAFIVYSSPHIMWVVLAQLYYFWYLRKRVIVTTRDCFAWKQKLNAPIVSLITDSINGQVNLRALDCHKYFLSEFWRLSDHQTEAHVTSNGVNRYSAFRIDMQAYYVASIFAAVSLFGRSPQN
jgi:ABC-type bacteriocin/lantibiotic exporter with double-glycine peptidase domain